MKKYLLSLAMTLIAVCSFAQSYTLSFKGYASSTGDYSKSYADTSLVADVFTEGCAAYVASIDAAANVYSARDSINGEYSPCGVKFGSAKAAGSLTFTLATPVEVDSIVFSAAMYGASEGVQGFSVNGVEYPLSAGNKVFEECVWKPEGVVSQITISQILAAKGRFYLNGITVYPKTSEVEPGEEPGGEEPGEEPAVSYEGTALKLTPGGNSNLPLPEDAVRVFTFTGQWSSTAPTPNNFDASVYKEVVVEFGEALPFYYNTPYKNAAGEQQWGGVAAGNTEYRLNLATVGSITDFSIQNVQAAENCPNGFSIVKAYAVKLDGTQDPIYFNAPGWNGSMSVEADIYAANVTFNGQWANVGLDGLAGVEGRKLIRMYTNEPIPAGNVQYCIVTADGADGWPQLTIREENYAETIIKETLKSSVIQWTSETPGNIDIAAVTYEVLPTLDTEALAAEIALADSVKATYPADAEYIQAIADAIAAAQIATDWAMSQEEVDSILNVLKAAEATAATEYKKSLYADIADGTYHFANMEAKAFLSNGAYWGTRSVFSDAGIGYNVVRNVENGKYTLYSGIKGATKALRPSDGFNDQSGEWEILKAEGGVYLFNGTKYFSHVEGSMIPDYVDEPTAGSVWTLVTAEEIKAAVAEATPESPTDATIYIQAPDFLNSDVANAAWENNKVGGANAGGNTILNNTNCEAWNKGAFTISQTITGIPNGIYSLSAYGFYREGNRTDAAAADAYENGTENASILKANEVSVALKSVYSEAKEAAEGGWTSESTSTSGKVYYIPNSQGDAAACFETGAYINNLENIEVTDSTLTISVSREGDAIFDWTVFDNLRLTYYGAKAEPEPELAVPTFSELATDGETIYYLYNVETHAFVTGGNNWGTRASGNIEKGNQVKVSANGETYKISDLVGANWNAFDVDGNKDSWVDGQGRAGDGTWVITPNGDNTYTITNTVAGDLKWGIQLDMANSRVQFKSNAAYGYTWAFVSADDYNAYMEVIDKEGINALLAANTAIVEEALIEEYNAANAIALEEMKKLIDGTNVYGEGYDAYVQKYEDYKAKYEANELKEFIVNPAAATGWHASTDYNFLLTPWTIGDKAANNWDASLYINTWSVEGTTDGSNFLVPFFEYWTGDSNSLGENTISTTLTGLEAGKTYEVSAWTRVRMKDGAEGDATGITFQAGEGEAVDACAGEQVGTSQFRLMEVKATGNADADGNLVVAFNVAADNNISWLSYKNVKYTEVPAAPEITYSDLTADDFKEWDDCGANANVVGPGYGAYDLNTSCGLPYGDGNVDKNHYADLSDCSVLAITVSEGTPRPLFNRDIDNGQAPDHLIDIPNNADQTAKYQTVVDNGDGTTTYIINVAQIVADYGYAHLHCVKGAYWANTTVTSLQVGREEAETPTEAVYAGIIEQTLSHPSAGVMGTTTSEQTVTVSVVEEGLVNITFSGFELPVMGSQIPEFTIENVTVTEGEVSTLSAGNFVVGVPMGAMTVNYNGTLTGILVNDTPVLHLTLQNATTDDVYFGVDQAAIDALKAYETPEVAETWTKTGYVVPAEGWTEFYEPALGMKVTVTGVVGGNELTISDGTNSITLTANADGTLASMKSNGTEVPYADGGWVSLQFASNYIYAYPNYDCFASVDEAKGYATISAWFYNDANPAGIWGYVNIEWYDGIEEDVNNLLTGINGVKATAKDGKFFQNGKIVIVRNGVKYNVNGSVIK